MMKRIFATLLIALSVISCNNKEKAIDITGEWQIADAVMTRSINIGNTEIDIYIQFMADNTFSIWQMIGYGRYQEFTGSWTLAENNILNGSYSDGTAWGNSYKVEIIDGNLIMTAQNGSSDIYTYVRCTIPSDIKN